MKPPKRVKSDMELQDFSLKFFPKLNHSLDIEPYQSSQQTVCRYADGNCRIYITYERERDEISIEGLIITGALTLPSEKMLDFLNDIKKINPVLHLRINQLSGNALIVFPRINYGIIFPNHDFQKNVEASIHLIKNTLRNLKKIEEIFNSYKKYDVTFKNLKNMLDKLEKEKNRNKKGKFLEDFISNLILIDKNFNIISTSECR
jgi:hypothetical protein